MRVPDPRYTPVGSARGHVETFEGLVKIERDRLEEGGPYSVDEAHSRRMLEHYERRLDDARKMLKSAEDAAKPPPSPLA